MSGMSTVFPGVLVPHIVYVSAGECVCQCKAWGDSPRLRRRTLSLATEPITGSRIGGGKAIGSAGAPDQHQVGRGWAGKGRIGNFVRPERAARSGSRWCLNCLLQRFRLLILPGVSKPLIQPSGHQEARKASWCGFAIVRRFQDLRQWLMPAIVGKSCRSGKT